MPPRSKVSREDIVDAAFSVVRECGIEQMNTRHVAQQLGCSTQPVMYHFKTMEILRQEVYERADLFHTEYLLSGNSGNVTPFLRIGLNYIRFAREEAPLFRFLFQSGYSPHRTIVEIVDSDELRPLLSALQKETGLGLEQAKGVFMTLALLTHGCASLLSNHHIEYDEALVISHLKRALNGAILAAQEQPK